MTIYDPSRPLPLLIPEAIAREEGWLNPASRCRRNNNPGNLDYEPWEASRFGAALEIPSPGQLARFGAFPSPEHGFAALVHRCRFPDVKGGTLARLISIWAPPNENNTSVYLENVAEWCAITAATIIDDYLGV